MITQGVVNEGVSIIDDISRDQEVGNINWNKLKQDDK